jgi:hypothetical protein
LSIGNISAPDCPLADSHCSLIRINILDGFLPAAFALDCCRLAQVVLVDADIRHVDNMDLTAFSVVKACSSRSVLEAQLARLSQRRID